MKLCDVAPDARFWMMDLPNMEDFHPHVELITGDESGGLWSFWSGVGWFLGESNQALETPRKPNGEYN